MRLTSKTINYTVGTIAELEALAGYDENAVVVVTDENRGGTFVYRSANVATNNGGTIFNGWTRQYDGAVNIRWWGFVGETLYADTSIYKTISYNVDRYTTNQDVRATLVDIANDSSIHTLDISDTFLYLSFTDDLNWSGKTIIGNGGDNCGFIYGQITCADGTKGFKISNIGFHGSIAHMELPLPVTNDVSKELTAGWFWYLDDLDFGFGLGSIGIKSVASTGNSSDITIEDCLFTMRDAVFGSGAYTTDRNNPERVSNVVFRNNTTNGIMFHGVAGIDIQNCKVYGNSFNEHYNGYAVDFSEGSTDCEAYNNTGDRLAAGVKAEGVTYGTNLRNKFYNNTLTIRGVWGSTGTGFNLGFRDSGIDTELINNTFTFFTTDTTTTSKCLFDVEGLRTIVAQNEVYIKGVPDQLSWIFYCNHASTGIGQSIDISRNNIYNQTAISPDFMLITGVGRAYSTVKIDSNVINGLITEFVSIDYTDVTTVISRMYIGNNVFPNTALFNIASQVSIGYLDIYNNIITPKSATRVIGLAFLTCAGIINIQGNKVKNEEGGANNVSFVLDSSQIGNVSTATINISGNIIDPISGSIVYFYAAGANVNVGSIVIHGNQIRFKGSISYTTQFLIHGATTFVMTGNSLINDYDTSSVYIARPTDGANSKYLYNTTIGTFIDSPGV